MSRLDEALKGFCWGLGFAISSVLVYVAFLMYAHAGILYKNQKVIEDLYQEDFANYSEFLQPEVINFKIHNNGIVINSKAKETGSHSILKDMARLRFTLFGNESRNSNPNFIGICNQSLATEHSGDEWSYYQTDCEIKFGNPEDVKNIKVTISS
ncbi:MAG: hypothetical protein WA963_01925 [Bermanella sp.]